jgi:gag-polypeptide of LTR copia-type
VWDIVETGYVEPENVALLTVQQLKLLKEKKVASKTALYILYQGVDEAGFEKVAEAITSKEAWGILQTTYKGDDRVKQIRLQTLRGEFEMLRMNNTEGISNYITIVQTIMNQLKRNGESLSEQRVVEKILRSLTDTFKNVVYVREELKDLAELTVDELAGSFLAHEQTKNLKKKETLEDALQAKVVLEEKALYV